LKFCVGVFNQAVKDCEKNGDTWDESKTNISSEFSEVIYFDYTHMESAEQVIRVAEKQFPRSQGFRIDFIKAYED